ncbi:MAG: hypothetical protein WC005_00890 [Candidatus Nanopelagicales bacterium]
MKVQRIFATTAAGLALVASVPLVASVASADNNGRDHGRESSSHSQKFTVKVTLTQAQYTVIAAARKTYLTTAASVNTTLHNALVQVQIDISGATSAQKLALVIAQDAFEFASQSGVDTAATRTALDQAQAAYQSAVTGARSAAQAKTAAAKTAASTALDKARTDYQAAVTAAFPSGTVVPKDLLNPPHQNFKWMHENESWNSMLNSQGLHLGFGNLNHR